MGKPGFVRNAQDDSEPWRALRRWLDSQQEPTPIFDSLIQRYQRRAAWYGRQF